MRTQRPFLLATLGLLLCAPQLLLAQAGELDLTFNTTGYNVVQGGFQDVYQDVTVQADGKIVAVGTKLNPGFITSDLRIARYNANGTPDNTFGTNGMVDYVIGDAQFGYGVEVLADGKILVAGGVSDQVGSLQWLLLRLNADGSTDISFALGGFQLVDYINGNEDLAYEMAVQPDGKILLAGVVVDSLQRYTPAIYRFTENGFLDMDFGVDGLAIVPVVEAENEFSNIKVRPDGKIVAIGHYSEVFNDWGVLVAQFDTNGVLDPSFGTGGYTVEPVGYIQAEAYGLALTGAGDIIVAGTTKDSTITFDMFVGQLQFHRSTRCILRHGRVHRVQRNGGEHRIRLSARCERQYPGRWHHGRNLLRQPRPHGVALQPGRHSRTCPSIAMAWPRPRYWALWMRSTASPCRPTASW